MEDHRIIVELSFCVKMQPLVELGPRCSLMWLIKAAGWIVKCTGLYSVQILPNAAKLMGQGFTVQMDNEPKPYAKARLKNKQTKETKKYIIHWLSFR